MTIHHFAYIDPGAGALIWQSIIGIFVGMAFYLRRTRKMIGALMTRLLRPGSVKQDAPETSLPLAKPGLEADRL